MTDTHITELRKLAEKATPGAWELSKSNNGTGVVSNDGRLFVEAYLGYSGEPVSDLEYIAAVNPKTVLELLDRLERAEAELALLQQPEQYYKRQSARAWNAIVERADQAEAAIERVRELHYEVEGIHCHTVCAHRYCKDDDDDQHAWPCPTIAALDCEGEKND